MSSGARHYGCLRLELKRIGCPIGSKDRLFTAHVLVLAATSVTNNVQEVARIDDLRIRG
jgi:predicted nucleic acid-binding protein